MKQVDGTGGLLFRAAGASDLGQRKNNEDAYLIDEDIGLFIVADGMGGHDKGEVASWFSSKNLDEIVGAVLHQRHNVTLDDSFPLLKGLSQEDLLEYAVFSINRNLNEENERAFESLLQKISPEDREIAATIERKKRMGTTLVSVLFRGRRAYITNIGDSRAYRIIGDSISQLTHDHSWVDEQVRAGKLTPEDARMHEKRNVITRSLGFKPEVQADFDVLTVYPSERFLLCSDGLSNVLPGHILLDKARTGEVVTACQNLVKTAKTRGGRDNITAVLIDVLEARTGDSPDGQARGNPGEDLEY